MNQWNNDNYACQLNIYNNKIVVLKVDVNIIINDSVHRGEYYKMSEFNYSFGTSYSPNQEHTYNIIISHAIE